MAKRGAPFGNQNAKKDRDWESAIRRALSRKHGTVEKGLDHLATLFIQAIENQEAWAIKEFGDRIEGKARQAIDLAITEISHEDALRELIDD